MKKVMWVVLSFVLVLVTACSSGTKSSTASTAPSASASAAPTAAPASAAPKQETVELRMLWWGSQDRHDLTLKAIQLFEQKNPNIKVKSEFASFDGYWDKLSVQVSGGNAPDVIQMSTAYLNDYTNRGAMMELSNAGVNLADIAKGTLSSGQIGGKLYAIPAGISALIYTYDPALLEKAGVKLPERMTWDDLGNIAKQVADKIGGGAFGVPDESGAPEVLNYFARQKGQSIYKDGKIGITPELLTEWFNYWTKLRKNGATSSAEVTASYFQAPLEKYLLITGKTPFALLNTNQHSSMAGLANRPLQMALMPTGGTAEGYYFSPSMYWSASAKTKYPKETAKLLDFLLNDIDAGKILVANRGVPVSSKVRDALQSTLSAADKLQFAMIDKISPLAQPIDVIDPQGAGEVRKLLLNLSQEVQFGKKASDAAAKEFVEKANALLAKSK